MKSGFLFPFAGSSPRWPSPRRRVSQRITSAPNSHNTRATVGPAAPVVNSTTRIPSRGSLLIKVFFLVGSLWSPEYFTSDHSARAQGGEIVIAHAKLSAIDLFVMFADQGRRAANPPRR